MYRLSNNQIDRINYDEKNRIYFDEQIAAYLFAGGKPEDIDRSIFEIWFDIEQENVDDREEAEARAWSTFEERLSAALTTPARL